MAPSPSPKKGADEARRLTAGRLVNAGPVTRALAFVVGEKPVQILARGHQDFEGRCGKVAPVPPACNVHGRMPEVQKFGPQRTRGVASSLGLKEVLVVLSMLVDPRQTLCRQRRIAAPFHGVDREQALVLKRLQGRVDRSGARGPESPATVLYRSNQVVAVAGLLREEHEDRRADVPTGTPASWAAPPPFSATAAWAPASRASAAARPKPSFVVGKRAVTAPCKLWTFSVP